MPCEFRRSTQLHQFGSANWFWERWVNSYALQVEPVAHRLQDEVILEPAEALHTQRARDLFFRELRARLDAELNEHAVDSAARRR
jgi:hypothetical protein